VEAIRSGCASTNLAVAVGVAVAAAVADNGSVSVVCVLVEVVVLIRSYKEARPLNVGLGVNPMLCIRVR
jgi:ACR3 family arsenite efflux pump ArsB